jgi:hypothetical protein
VGFVIDKGVHGQDFLCKLQVPPSSRIPSTLKLVIILTLLLLEEQRGEAWEPADKTMFRVSRKEEYCQVHA